MTMSNLMKMAESSPNWSKTLGKEKLLVFRRLVQQTRKNQGLFGKGLTLYHPTKVFIGAENKCKWPRLSKLSLIE